MSAPIREWPEGWTHNYETDRSAKKSWSFGTEPDTPADSHSHRFELRAGDTNPTDSARELQYERSECAQEEPRQGRGETFWYAWSFQVPADFPDSRPVAGSSQQVHLAQFHQFPNPGVTDSPWHPPWMFGKRIKGPLCLRLFPTVEKENALWWSLIEDADFRGPWHQVLVHAHWSGDEKGFLKTWVDGVQKMAYFGPTCFDHDGPVYFKYGLYRPLSKHNGTAIALFSQLRRGHSREEVE